MLPPRGQGRYVLKRGVESSKRKNTSPSRNPPPKRRLTSGIVAQWWTPWGMSTTKAHENYEFRALGRTWLGAKYDWSRYTPLRQLDDWGEYITTFHMPSPPVHPDYVRFTELGEQEPTPPHSPLLRPPYVPEEIVFPSGHERLDSYVSAIVAYDPQLANRGIAAVYPDLVYEPGSTDLNWPELSYVPGSTNVRRPRRRSDQFSDRLINATLGFVVDALPTAQSLASLLGGSRFKRDKVADLTSRRGPTMALVPYLSPDALGEMQRIPHPSNDTIPLHDAVQTAFVKGAVDTGLPLDLYEYLCNVSFLQGRSEHHIKEIKTRVVQWLTREKPDSTPAWRHSMVTRCVVALARKSPLEASFITALRSEGYFGVDGPYSTLHRIHGLSRGEVPKEGNPLRRLLTRRKSLPHA